MRVTKHEHACLVVEQSGKTLVIDPGSFTTPLTDATGVVAIVVTHEHPDHWTGAQFGHILAKNPDARIFGPEGVVNAASEFEVERVDPGDSLTVGPFSLSFFGGKHAVIHDSIPVVDNVGVIVNEQLVYPGDSFAIPENIDVDTLAVPSSAPWLKVAEVIDFVTAVAPKRSFPTHEMIHSQAGKMMANQRIQAATEAAGGVFHPLEPGDSLDL